MIKAIIFDLGNTLMYFDAGWDEIERSGAEAMAEWFLKKKHIDLDQEALVGAYLGIREEAELTAAERTYEVTAVEALQRALEEISAPAAAFAHIPEAVRIAFAPEEANWHAYPDAIPTLKRLRAQGLKLGLLSNATDDGFVQRMVNRLGLRPYLSPTFSSAELGYRKPHPQALLAISQRWRLPPETIVMVGDTLNEDILGARRAGMRSVLARMCEAPSNHRERRIRPDATIDRLEELPEVIANWKAGAA